MKTGKERFGELLEEMPSSDADFFKVLSWGHRFNAYDHWVSDPSTLFDVLKPLLDDLHEHGHFTVKPGCDAIRALMFYKVREQHFTDGDPKDLLSFYQALHAYVELRANN